MAIRVFALAKELGIESKELIEYLNVCGIPAKNSALTSISPEERDSFLEKWPLSTADFLASVARREGGPSRVKRLLLKDRRLSELPEDISEFKAIEEIDLSKNEFSKFPQILLSLTNLKQIIFAHNRLADLPSEVQHFQSLELIDVSTNQLTEIPECLYEIRSLKVLRIQSNSIRAIPPRVGSLRNLIELDIRKNLLEELPVELQNIPSLERLLLHHNLSLKIPPEILGKENPPESLAKKILTFWFAPLRAQDRRKLLEAKILVVGQGGVGKTSLVNRLLLDSFDEREQQTDGINIASWNVRIDPTLVVSAVRSKKKHRGKKKRRKEKNRLLNAPKGNTNTATDAIRLNVWDFGGQEIMHATHQFFLTKRSVYLVVLDSRAGEQEGNIHYWMKTIQSYGDDSPVLIVINKSEHPHHLELDERRLKLDYAPNIVSFHYVSCKTKSGIHQLKGEIYKAILQMPHVFDEVPAAYFEIKQNLEARAKTEDFISRAEFQSTCELHGVRDIGSQEQLLQFLHDLGSVLHYDDPRQTYQVHDTNVLNPEWVTGGVYKIITNHQLRVLGDGKVRRGSLPHLFSDLNRYPKAKHGFLVELMRKFDLCFEFPDSDDLLLVPELLSVQEPDVGWGEKVRLDFEIHYPVLPRGLIPRFIVRTHHLLSTHPTYWRSGVVLDVEGCRVLVRGDVRVARVYIQIQHGNSATRRRALAIVLDHFKAIHSGISRLEPKFKVPLPDDPSAPPVDFEHLRRLEDEGTDIYLFEGANRHYSVKELLHGVSEPIFDVFLCHNSHDKPIVREIAKQLRTQRIRPWLDEVNLTPGQPWQRELVEAIECCRTVAVMIGPIGVGKWAIEEMRLALDEAVNLKKPIIPVVLPGSGSIDSLKQSAELRILLQRTVVNLREGVTDEGVMRFIEGILSAIDE